jgi:Ca-activated chloride channel homolog
MKKYPSGSEIYRYPIFQIPAIALISCLLATLLVFLLGLGKPVVAVGILLDLSESTEHPVKLANIPTGIKVADVEVSGVKAYLESNANLSVPNQVQIFGFAGEILPLTKSLATDKEKIMAELNMAMSNKDLHQNLQYTKTDINKALETGINTLNKSSNACKSLLLVTDGEANVSQDVINNASSNNVKINSVVVGAEASQIREATVKTGGIYLSPEAGTLEFLFGQKIFDLFNNNIKWIGLCLGATWISLMWVLVLPIDRWILQSIFGHNPNIAGTLAMGNALFWSALVPIVIFGLFKLPVISNC